MFNKQHQILFRKNTPFFSRLAILKILFIINIVFQMCKIKRLLRKENIISKAVIEQNRFLL